MSPSLQLWRRNDAALDLRNYRHPDRADMGGGADVHERWGSGMNDIVERLRDAARFLNELEDFPELQIGAAEEITRLREDLASAKRAAEAYEAWKFPEDIQALTVENERLREENARLREALKPFAARIDNLEKSPLTKHACAAMVEIEHLRAAAAAIREGGKDD